jgi:hypothetical protein
MTKQRDVLRQNPYAIPVTSEHDDPRVTQMWEEIRTQSPKLYQNIKRQEARVAAAQTRPNKVLDNPVLMAELEAMAQAARHKFYTNEYTLLGIEPGATKREIKNAYRRQARRLHPDKGGDPEAFKAMYAAYRRLLAVTPA